ncbi:unnamed protein product [Closterium sp. Naga37s-1]|nr:unnamed protein product [Closterium sp. Naga37s-1]
MADAEADARAFAAAEEAAAAATGSAASGPTGSHAEEEEEAPVSPRSPTPLPTAHVEVEEAEVASKQELVALLKQHEATHTNVFLLFLADHVPSTNRSWCPDCRKSEPVVATAVATLRSNPITAPGPVPTALLVRVWAGDRPTWKSPLNPFRSPPFAVRGVPTLMHWDWAAAPAAPHQAALPAAPAAADASALPAAGDSGGGGDGGVQGAPGRQLGEYETRKVRLVMELMVHAG